MLVPLCQLSSPYDTSVVTSVALCAVTFVASSPVVSATLFVPPSGGGSTKPNCKCRWEDSSLYAEKMELWADFEKIWAVH